MISFIKDFRYLKKNQYRLDKRKLENLQLNLLKQMYDFAISNSPFYRKLYEGKQFRDLNDFYQLPIIDKQIMMDNFSEVNTFFLDKETLMEYAIDKERNKDYLGYYNGLSSFQQLPKQKGTTQNRLQAMARLLARVLISANLR